MPRVNRALPVVALIALLMAVPVTYISLPSARDAPSLHTEQAVPSIQLPAGIFHMPRPAAPSTSCPSAKGDVHPSASPLNFPAAGTGAAGTTNRSLFLNNTAVNTTLVAPDGSGLATNQYMLLGIGDPVTSSAFTAVGVAETSVAILGPVAVPAAYLPNGSLIAPSGLGGPFLTFGNTYTFAITHVHGNWWSYTYNGNPVTGGKAWQNGTYNLGVSAASGFFCQYGYPLTPSFIVGLYGKNVTTPTLPKTNVPWAIGIEPSGQSATSYVPSSANAMPQFNATLGVVGIQSHVQNPALRINQLTVGSYPSSGVPYPGSYVPLWGKYSVQLLSSATLSPTLASLAYNGTQVFSTTALNETGVSLPGVKYSWQYSPATLGSLNSTVGSSVTFAAGSKTVSGSIWSNMTFNCTTLHREANITVTKTGGPSIVSFNVSSSPVITGMNTTFTVVNASWPRPITYQYAGLPPNCVSSNTTKLLCKPSGSGNFTVKVFLNDTALHSSNATVLLTVDNALKIVSFTATPSTITLTQSVTISTVASGGVTPLIYNYTGLPRGCPIGTYSASFSCTPSATGTFTIKVYVNDTAGYSHLMAQANLSVNVKLAVTNFLATPSSFPLGGTTYLNVTASGGTKPYSYLYSGLPQGCTSVNLPNIVCKPTINGTFPITVSVTGADKFTANGTTSITVTPPPKPWITGFTATPNPVNVSKTTVLQTNETGGTAPISYFYAGLPPGCVTSNAAKMSCTPTSSGSFPVSVTVTDKNGSSNSSHINLVVKAVSAAAPTISAFSISPSAVVLGTSTTFSVTATGAGTLTYSYSPLPPGCVSENVASFTCTPSKAGSYNVTVTVTNSGGSDSNTKPLTVSPVGGNGGPTISSFVASPQNVMTGQATTLRVNASGGSPPLTYTYTGLPSGCSTSNAASITCTPTSPGNYTLRVYVNDSKGNSQTVTTLLQVTGTAIVAPSGSSIMILLLLVIAAVAVVAVATALVLHRRKKKQGQLPPLQPYAQGPYPPHP